MRVYEAPPRRSRQGDRQRQVRNRQEEEIQAEMPLPNIIEYPLFWNRWTRFKEENPGRPIYLVVGIGTSGSRNPAELARYVQEKREENPDRAIFILLIDGEYRENENVDVSLSRLVDQEEGLGYHREQGQPSVSAIHDSGSVVYLWGENLPSAHRGNQQEQMARYDAVRDDMVGPYEYGRGCDIQGNQDIRRFYLPLLLMFRDPAIEAISVYNQGFTNARILGYGRERVLRYQGPMFQAESRVIPIPMSSTMIADGLYFENFCEILFCLSQSQKPVYSLKRHADRDELVQSPMYNIARVVNQNLIGGRAKRRSKKTRKTRRRSRSHSRRK